jgi:TRAP-type C4-dicarboxylate transport system substrate-binding protein
MLSHVAQAQDYNLTLVTIPIPGETYAMLTEAVPRHVAAATNGKVKITVNESLIPGTQLHSAVRDGRVELSGILPAYISAEAPFLTVGNLPGIVTTIEEYKKLWASPIFQAKTEPIWREKYNVKVLAYGAFGPQNIMSMKPIMAVSDFKGMKVRVSNTQSSKLVEGLGAKPTPMVITEVMPALERGILDAVQNSVVGSVYQGFPAIVKHSQLWPLGTIQPWTISVNLDVWAKFPEDIQKGMANGMLAVQREMFDRWQPMLDEAIIEWKKKGIEVKTPSPEEIAKMNTGPHAQAVFDAWNARSKQLGLDPEAFLKDVRTVLAQ